MKLVGGFTHGSARRKLSVRPNELSEEMVRSISLLYHRYAETQSYSAPAITSRQCLPYVRRRSRSFSSAVDVQESEDNLHSCMDQRVHDPYGMRESWDIGNYSRCVEVNFAPEEEKLKEYEAIYRHFRYDEFFIQRKLHEYRAVSFLFTSVFPEMCLGWSTNYFLFPLDPHHGLTCSCSSCNCRIERQCALDSPIIFHAFYRGLVESLQHVDPRDMAHEQRLAFWINVYNTLMMHVSSSDFVD